MMIVAFLSALVFSTFSEYWLHRLAHAGVVIKKLHWSHHQRNHTDGYLRELIQNLWITLQYLGWSALLAGILFGLPFGLMFLCGEVAYTALAVYAHELQHAHPEQVFWMRRPIHYLHHRHHKGTTNFGLVTDFWDRVFGTSASCGWQRREPISIRKLLAIKWL